MSENNIPEDLPYKIINKELELEHNCTILIVNELVNMYRLMIEAYESANDPRFADFQTRLHKILMRPDVQTMLRQESTIAKKKRQKESKEIELKTTRHNFRSRKTASVEIEQAKISRHLSRIMENRENMDKGLYNKAVIAIGSQDLNLKERLERRKRQGSVQNMRKNNYKVVVKDTDEESTEREKKLEELMEKHFTEKAEELHKIQVKYSEKIRSESGKSAAFGLERDEEIKIQSEMFDLKRKLELQKFKEEFGTK